jgi:hypothetical protein
MDTGIPITTPDEEKYENVLGVFEGGGYVAKGVFRPTINSIMKTLSYKSFNKPSIDAIKSVLDSYTKKAAK